MIIYDWRLNFEDFYAMKSSNTVSTSPLEGNFSWPKNVSIYLKKCSVVDKRIEDDSGYGWGYYPKSVIGMVYLGLWHINHCWSFNAKSFSYVYIKYMILKRIL